MVLKAAVSCLSFTVLFFIVVVVAVVVDYK